jgi:PAS domain S-box-containing protein
LVSSKVRILLPWRHGFVLAVVLAGGFCASLSLQRSVQSWERDRLQSMLSNRASERAQLLRTEVLRSMEALRSIASLITTTGDVNRKTFRDFVQSALTEQPDLQALGWTPRVPRDARARYEAAAQADGWPNFEFTEKNAQGKSVRAADRAEYFPVYYVEPVKTNYPAVGFELDSEVFRRTAMQQARRSGLAVATSPIRLVQESDNQLGFVVYLPIYGKLMVASGAPRDNDLTGFASAVFRIQDLVRPLMQDLASEGLEVQVFDSSEGGRSVFHLDTPAVSAGIEGTAELSVAGRRWLVVLRPAPEFVAAHSGAQASVIFLTGLIITLLLTAYLYAGLRRTAEIKLRVEERTEQLSAEVAERKRAEEAARLAEARYRSIFENSIEGIFQTSTDGGYLSANRSLARIYGYKSIDQLICDLTNIAGQLYVEPRRREEFVQLVQRNGAVSEFESQIFRKDGRVIWISENARAVRDEEGRVLYFEGTVVDVTERKLAEGSLRRNRDELESRVRDRTLELARINQALEEEVAVRKRAEEAAAAANRAKSAFLASMSHEIRTPMNAILGYAQVLERDPTLRASQREALQTVLSSGNHLLELIDDVLDISKIEAGRVELRPTEFELDGLLRDVAGMFRQRCRQKSIALRVEDMSGESRRVIGDERKLRQVLINLMGNAVKFTDHGSVTLRVQAQQNDCYRFEVIDTGIGIALNARGAIFEAFNQGPTDHRRGGSGLGLAISRQHIELIGGHLTVTSSHGGPDSGSTFSFTVPLMPPERDETPEGFDYQSVVRLAEGHNVRALVVDDVQENRNLLGRMLAMVGCEVSLAENSDEALANIEQNTPNIVFIDILMPGMNGVATAREIRERFGIGRIKLVAASASALEHEQQEYLDAGFDAFLAKPLRCQWVYRMLASLLGVEYEREIAPQPQPEPTPSAVGLSRELCERLLDSARQYRITELKQCIDEIERLGPSSTAMPDFLRGCIRRYDMESILDALSGEYPVSPGNPPVPNLGVS